MSSGVKIVQEKAQPADREPTSTLAPETLPLKQLTEAGNPLDEQFEQVIDSFREMPKELPGECYRSSNRTPHTDNTRCSLAVHQTLLQHE